MIELRDDISNWYLELKEIDKKEKIIAIAVAKNNYTGTESFLFDNIESAKEILNYDFDSGYGGSNGSFFTAWTKDVVYFPAVYDGAEWIASVPRNPCNNATKHVGGE